VGISTMPPDRPLIVWEPSATTPAGYIKANGAIISRTAYTWLFGRIGVTFGAGDGSTTFAIPDLRGEFLRGLDDGRGVDSARVLGSAQTDSFQGHWHKYGALGGSGGVSASNSSTSKSSQSSVVAFDATSDGINGTPRVSAETRPRNLAGLYCIAYAP